MKRRSFLTLLGGAAASAWPLAARAQQGKVWRIGFLGSTEPTPGIIGTLRDELRQRGYIEGQNLALDIRWLGESPERNSAMVAELVRGNVDAIVAWATPAVAAARRATSTIPIVMFGIADPVGLGFIASLARPGGNVTGVSNLARDLSAKLVEFLVEIVPGIRRVGVVYNPNNPSLSTLLLREVEEALRVLRLDFEVVGARVPEAICAGLRTPAREQGRRRRLASRSIPDQVWKKHCRACAAGKIADCVSAPRECRRWRLAVIRAKSERSNSPGNHLCRSHPERSQARRPPRGTADQVRIGGQS
jgi:putative ABC transport system substrate-binding protein